MNESMIIDYLISQSNRNTFFYDKRSCSLSLLQEVILRGFQVRTEIVFVEGRGFSSGRGFSNYFEREGCGDGRSLDYEIRGSCCGKGSGGSGLGGGNAKGANCWLSLTSHAWINEPYYTMLEECNRNSFGSPIIE